MNCKSVIFIMLWSLLSMACSDGAGAVVPEPDEPEIPVIPSPDEPEPVAPDAVVYKSYKNLVLAGYQGWFTAKGDASGTDMWIHCGDTKGDWQMFMPGHCSIEFFPSMGEYVKSYPTGFTSLNGTTAMMFSSQDYETVDLHFKWMQQYGIDGVVVQRFLEAVKGYPWMDTVLDHIVKAAKKYNRAFCIMYDLSGLQNANDVQVIVDDWNKINSKYRFSDPAYCPTYLWERGLPVVGLWGAAFVDMKGTPEHFTQLMDRLAGLDGKFGKLSYLLGTSFYWHRGTGEAESFASWERVYKKATIISPWAVGRYSDETSFNGVKAMIQEDRNWCKVNDVLYAPVVFPGFSWHNLQLNNSVQPYDQIPRKEGTFYWSQIAYHLQNEANMLYVAMFDEMDEGTCIFKCTTQEDTPSNATESKPEGRFLSYEIADDLYLFLTGEAGKWLKGEVQHGTTPPVYVPR